MQTRNVILGLAALTLSQTTLSQEPQKVPAKKSNGWYISLGEVSFNTKTADEEGVKDSATYLRFAWEGQSDSLVYGAGLSGYFYSDRREFSQRVEDSSGDESTESSSAEAINAFFEGGYSHALSDNFSVDLLGGYELVLQSERGISFCSDCDSSNIDIDAGLYTTPRIKFTADNGLMLAATYHHYFSGDVENAYSMTFGWTY